MKRSALVLAAFAAVARLLLSTELTSDGSPLVLAMSIAAPETGDEPLEPRHAVPMV
jgi:hypothetical protein